MMVEQIWSAHRRQPAEPTGGAPTIPAVTWRPRPDRYPSATRAGDAPRASPFRGRSSMKALRLHEYGQPPRLDDVPEPIITGPHDVIVKVAGAGLCRTDMHIRDGWFAAAVPVDLPL